MNAHQRQLRQRSIAGASSRAALTLLEMMVAVTLLAVIMIGLLAMFNQTQKALHAARAQTDIFENLRGAIQMIARDVAEMAAADQTNVVNFDVVETPSIAALQGWTLPNGFVLNPVFDDVCWLNRANDTWQAIGYFVDGAKFGVGTLYRYAETGRRKDVTALIGEARSVQATNAHHVSDGIVHFQTQAVYVDGTNQFGQPNFFRTNIFQFSSDALPAFVDFEIGVLEPATLKQFQALTNELDPSVPEKFLRARVEKIHFFRERVPIRNFVNPYRANDVP
jgi:hypothetical protein